MDLWERFESFQSYFEPPKAETEEPVIERSQRRTPETLGKVIDDLEAAVGKSADKPHADLPTIIELDLSKPISLSRDRPADKVPRSTRSKPPPRSPKRRPSTTEIDRSSTMPVGLPSSIRVDAVPQQLRSLYSDEDWLREDQHSTNPVPPRRKRSQLSVEIPRGNSVRKFSSEWHKPRKTTPVMESIKKTDSTESPRTEPSSDNSLDYIDLEAPATIVVVPETFDHPKAALQSSPQKRKKYQKQHIRWFGHGVFWTVVALTSCFLGSIFSVLARRSTHFALLETPLYIAPIYEPLEYVGMLQLEPCHNVTLTGKIGCTIMELTTDDVQDDMFELSRTFLSLGTAFGIFFSLFLASATFWESINLRPLCFGFLLTYFFQSFSMLFFDTKLCGVNHCRVGPGCIMSIIASLCWILACVSTAKMDTVKIRARRQRRRAARKKHRQERKAQREEKRKAYERKASSSSNRTGSSTSSETDIESPRGSP